MINILCDIPILDDASSFYRGMGPLSQLRKKLPVNLVTKGTPTWDTLSTTDILFMQRPFSEDHLKLATLARSMGVPIWMDFDDLLTDVPSDNPTFFVYGQPKVKRTVELLLELADHITVPTQALKDVWSALLSFDPKITVIPSGFPDHVMRLKRPFEYKPIVSWRGGMSHERDLRSVEQTLIKEIDENPYRLWNFIGYHPWYLVEGRKNVNQHPFIPLENYHEYLCTEVMPTFHLVPLHDTLFNRCKSDISWMEGVLAGAAVIASESMPEFDRPGVHYFEDMDGLQGFLTIAPSQLKVMHLESWNFIQENRTLERLNQNRIDIILSLLKTAS